MWVAFWKRPTSSHTDPGTGFNAKTKDTDPEAFARDSVAVCDAYRRAPEAHMLGQHVISTDEKTGIQALERIAPTKPTRPGLIERVEFEYIRHGTLCLTANFEVATGEVVSYTIGPTRNELDFADHVSRAVATDPAAIWTFVADHLNTHLSATLVEYVAGCCGISDLGKKGKSGILATMASREAFLADATHRFVYTPKHCSWLNQPSGPGSDLVQRTRPTPAEAELVRVVDGAARADRVVHPVLQRDAREAVPMDLHRASACRMSTSATGHRGEHGPDAPNLCPTFLRVGEVGDIDDGGDFSR